MRPNIFSEKACFRLLVACIILLVACGRPLIECGRLLLAPYFALSSIKRDPLFPIFGLRYLLKLSQNQLQQEKTINEIFSYFIKNITLNKVYWRIPPSRAEWNSFKRFAGLVWNEKSRRKHRVAESKCCRLKLDSDSRIHSTVISCKKKDSRAAAVQENGKYLNMVAVVLQGIKENIHR